MHMACDAIEILQCTAVQLYQGGAYTCTVHVQADKKINLPTTLWLLCIVPETSETPPLTSIREVLR